jgi:hypothetical protein
MRANSSCSSLIVVVLAFGSGCSPAEDPSVVVESPEPPAPQPAPSPATLDDLVREVEVVRSGPTRAVIDEIREGAPTLADREGGSESSAEILPPPVRRLVFQCTDDVTFAVRSVGGRVEVFPPRHSNGYIVLLPRPSESGLYYTARGAELRINGELATLAVDRTRYVDCVSNPAAAVWQEPPREQTR